MMLAIEAPTGMTDVERLMMAVFIILSVAALLAVFIVAAKVSDIETRLDVLDDANTPSFTDEPDVPERADYFSEADTGEIPAVEDDPPEPDVPPVPMPPYRPSPAPRTDTSPTTEKIDSWRVDLDRQYQEAMAALDDYGKEQK